MNYSSADYLRGVLLDPLRLLGGVQLIHFAADLFRARLSLFGVARARRFKAAFRLACGGLCLFFYILRYLGFLLRKLVCRAAPGILCPCDGNEMRLAVQALIDYEGPAYMRLGRLAVETVTDSIPGYSFELGKGGTLRDGSDVTVIATGMNVQMALAAADKLAAEGISARVIDMHTIKPLDTELVLKAAKETGAIVTTEEANVLGGLGAAVAEYLSENYPVPVVRHGVNDEFGRSGKAPLVLDAYGVNADGIVAKVKQALAMKK